MTDQQRYHVIGLWQVWDDLPGVPDPRDCAPNALVEQHAGAFEERPNDLQTLNALLVADDAIGAETDEARRIAYVVVDDAGWRAMRQVGGWNGSDQRRHDRGDESAELATYGLPKRHSYGGAAWAPAKEHGARLGQVASMLRGMTRNPARVPGPEAPYERQASYTTMPRRREVGR